MASRSPSLNLKYEWVYGGSSIERLDLLRFYASIIPSCSSERSLQLLAMTEYTYLSTIMNNPMIALWTEELAWWKEESN